MFKTLLPYIIPAATAFSGWFFGFIYHRNERKSDLTIKLIRQIEDLTVKYIQLNTNYMDLNYRFCELKRENEKLKEAILTINPNFDILEEKQQ